MYVYASTYIYIYIYVYKLLDKITPNNSPFTGSEHSSIRLDAGVDLARRRRFHGHVQLP